MFCSSCGKPVGVENARFCPHCGSGVGGVQGVRAVAPVRAPATANVCKMDNCTDPRSEGSGYCAYHRPPSTAKSAASRVTPRANVSSAMVCPHCQTRGTVQTQKVKAKKGVSGGKATGALLTGGLSLFATGLSRKETVTQAHCANCGADWIF